MLGRGKVGDRVGSWTNERLINVSFGGSPSDKAITYS